MIPLGSNLVNTKASTNSSKGTPCCNPREIEIAKQFSRLLNAAPSRCISMKISPSWPLSYSPVLI